MSAILVVERDPVFGAVLEDRLHVAGHEVELLMDRGRARDMAGHSGADLLILEIGQPGNAGLEIVTALRGATETRSLPILVLSKSVESADRVAALRAGADDYLTKPCDLEELLLRAERLVDSRGAQAPLLQGDLATHPLWELVQYVQQTGRTGALVLRGPSGGGRLALSEGQILSAQWMELPPREALLTVLGMKRGRFRFVVHAAAAGAKAEPLALTEALMQAAWLEDELGKRGEHLPGTGVPLTASANEVPTPDESLEPGELPSAEIFEEVRKNPGSRLFDLIAQLPYAPQKIRLAVTYLVEKGALALPDDTSFGAYPSTSEITSTKILDMAVRELLETARKAGLGTSALPYLIAFEPGVKPALAALLEGVPGFQHNEPLRQLATDLEAQGAGSASFSTDAGKLSLHAEELVAAKKSAIEGVATVAAGVLLWLDDGAAPRELLELVVARLDKTDAATGVVVGVGAATRELAEELTEKARHWQVSGHAPQSLLGVLRLLHPNVER